MTDGFTHMLDEAIGFFRELATNNSKDWLEPRKEFYTERIRKPAELLAEIVGGEISRRCGVSHAAKVYRINRDVRFSKDKRPYNTHLHILWSRTSDEGAPAWFFAASPEYLMVATGSPDFSGEALDGWRRLVDRRGDDLQEAIGRAMADIGAGFGDWGTPPLKRVPKPYDEAHPHAELLKRKSLIVNAPLGETWRDEGLANAILRRVDGLLPIWRVMTEDRA